MATLVLGTLGVLVALLTGRGAELFGSHPWQPTVPSIGASLAVGALVVAALRGVRTSGPRPSAPAPSWPIVAALVGACCVAVLPHVEPRWFDSAAREDNVVEWATALAAICAAAAALLATRGRPVVERVALGAVAPLLFVIAGEEVSWLQRIVGYGTPEVLSASSQGEANLHNLATDRFQSAFYLGGAGFLVVVPHLARWAPRSLGPLVSLAPGRLSVTLGSVAVAFTYARTGNLVHHLTVWAVLGVLATWGAEERRWAWSTLLTVVACQSAVALAGDDLVRIWAPSEYREMCIALGLAAWATALVARTERGPGFTPRSRDGRSHASTVSR